MNVRLIELRAGERKIEYNTVVMSKLIHTQNKIITDELSKLGITVTSLKPVLDLEQELKKRSDAAYLAVKNKVDKAKRSEAEKAAAKAASMGTAAAGGGVGAAAGGVVVGGGSNLNSPAVAAAAAAAAAARLPPAPAAATAVVKTEDVKPVVATLAPAVAQQVTEVVLPSRSRMI